MVNYNGELIENDRALLTTGNRGLNYGDAVFETLRYSSGKILFWEAHYFRLMAAMRIMRMEIPHGFTIEFLENEVRKTLETFEGPASAFRIKILVWRKEGGKYRPETSETEYLISAETLDSHFYLFNEKPYEVELFKDYFVQSGLLSTLKTNNKAINVLGSIFAKENGFQNCILLNENKLVVEALNANLFLVKDKTIITPPLSDGCMNGILRKQLIALTRQLPSFEIEERSIATFDLQKADELFLTNVIVGIQPVSKYRKKEFSKAVSKELLGKLNAKIRLG